jgi:hypothetical protein
MRQNLPPDPPHGREKLPGSRPPARTPVVAIVSRRPPARPDSEPMQPPAAAAPEPRPPRRRLRGGTHHLRDRVPHASSRPVLPASSLPRHAAGIPAACRCCASSRENGPRGMLTTRPRSDSPPPLRRRPLAASHYTHCDKYAAFPIILIGTARGFSRESSQPSAADMSQCGVMLRGAADPPRAAPGRPLLGLGNPLRASRPAVTQQACGSEAHRRDAATGDRQSSRHFRLAAVGITAPVAAGDRGPLSVRQRWPLRTEAPLTAGHASAWPPPARWSEPGMLASARLPGPAPTGRADQRTSQSTAPTRPAQRDAAPPPAAGDPSAGHTASLRPEPITFRIDRTATRWKHPPAMKPSDIIALASATTAGTAAASDPDIQSAAVSFGVALVVYLIKWITGKIRNR